MNEQLIICVILSTFFIILFGRKENTKDREFEEPVKEKPKVHNWQCSSCMHTFTGWYKNCPACGALNTICKMNTPVIVYPSESDREEENLCKKCGMKLDEDAAFCPYCGEKTK